MISLILPTYHPDRVQRARDLYDMLKKDSGVEVEVIVVCENPEIVDKLKYDVLIQPPKVVGFTRAMNLGEKFAKYGVGWWIDDYVIPEPGWGPKALKGFYDTFPDGMGIMELSGYQTDCPKSISTRKFMYQINGGDWLWNEYVHCGDTESWYKATAINKFYVYPEILWHRNKIWDSCKTESVKTISFDTELRAYREKHGWSNVNTPDLMDRMKRWAYKDNDPKLIELYNNIFNLNGISSN